MACPGQTNAPFTAKGQGEAKDFGKAMIAALTNLAAEVLKAKAAWEKANPCPKDCSSPDCWIDEPTSIAMTPASGTARPLKSLHYELGYLVELTETSGIHQQCYENGTKRDAGKAAREAAALKAREEAAKAAKKEAEKKKDDDKKKKE